MNKNDVRAILNETGCPLNLTDRVISAFGTTDDAHHSPKNYQPNAERIKQYIGALRDLINFSK
jgi:lysophospholipase L1-like esterase